MSILEIKLENCFGIGSLDHKFDFGQDNSNSFIIYAPNGTMKTSFAKTMDLLSKNDSKSLPRDSVYENRTTKYDIVSDGDTIAFESILVVNAEDNLYDSSSKISSFIASKELKTQYDEIYNELDSRKNEYIKKLKQVSQSTDCEGEFIAAFMQSPKDDFLQLLHSVSDKIITKPETYNFRYNDIFDKKDNVKKFLDKNQKLLSEYVTKYEEILKKSKFFKSSNNTFGTYQANELLKSTADNSYFDAGHKFTLSDNAEIKSVAELKELLQNEIANIVNDEKLKKSFDQVDKAIGANTELRSFKSAIEGNNFLLVELDRYEDFRKKVWLNYVSHLANETAEIVSFYQNKKSDIEKIINEAKKEFEIWKEIIKKFNDRFYIPFVVKLVNQEDVVLKQETANLEFDYCDINDAPVRKDKNSLLSVLSKGEQRAFYILQFLFEVEARIQAGRDTLLVIDDIADSFDYKNKYAIIEYIKELHDNPKFTILILTHNFDFYRTVANRLNLASNRQCVLMALRNDAREIKLREGQYLKDIFSHFKKNIAQPKIFVSIIPLIRNLIEYTCGQGQEYLQLTSCLHLKDDTTSISCSDILNLIQNNFKLPQNPHISFATKTIKDFIYETADAISTENNIDEILLENKIALSIAIRLKAEEYMLSKIPNASTLVINRNQTSVLLKHFKGISVDKSILSVLERVNLMTPENIHVNAFMFEPLVDISVFHLIRLYHQVKQLQ